MRFLIEWECNLPQITLDNVVTTWYNDCVVNDKGKKMIIRKEYLNAISEMNSKNIPVEFMARVLNLAVADVAAAIKSFKL
jgi:hypothetical protein